MWVMQATQATSFTAIAFLVVKSITHNTRKLLLLMKLGIVLTVLVDHQIPPFNTVNAIDVFHFDYQKNLPTPKLTAGKQFYLRLLWTYNFGVYCASRDVLCAFMWNELVAHRGANSVVSCLMKLIFSTRVGQNKHHCVIWFFQDLIRRGVYSRVDYKFLVVRHTYGPADR